jgi:hypothetical protein
VSGTAPHARCAALVRITVQWLRTIRARVVRYVRIRRPRSAGFHWILQSRPLGWCFGRGFGRRDDGRGGRRLRGRHRHDNRWRRRSRFGRWRASTSRVHGEQGARGKRLHRSSELKHLHTDTVSANRFEVNPLSLSAAVWKCSPHAETDHTLAWADPHGAGNAERTLGGILADLPSFNASDTGW